MFRIITLGAGFALSFTALEAATLTNGNFEAGNTGFTTDLTYKMTTGNGAGQYTVDTNPNAWFGAFASFGDHTSGSGNMMIVNGSTAAGATVWSQTITVAANTNYEFGGWIAAIFPGPSVLSFAIDAESIGTISGPPGVANWDGFSFNWSSGLATSATLSLLQGSTAFSGNDYALDDLSFVSTGPINPPSPIPLPAAGWALLAALCALFGLRRARI